MKVALLLVAAGVASAFVTSPVPIQRPGTALFARRQYEKISRSDFFTNSLLIAGVSVPVLKYLQQPEGALLEASAEGEGALGAFSTAGATDLGAPFAFSKPRSVAISELREMVKQFDNGAMRVRQPHPDVVQVGFRGQDQASVEFVVGDREMRARPLAAGECNGMRLINGFAEELSGKQGWKTLGYPLVCEAK